MRLINARIKGFGVLRDFVLDLGDYECGEIVNLTGPNGSGKCLPGGTRVYTPSGPVPIYEAVEFRIPEVLGYVGGRIRPVVVTGWHSLGEKPLLRITAQGWPIECATTHPILTDTGWRRAADIRPGDFIASARVLPSNGSLKCTAEEAELAGLLIGDGSMTTEAILCASDPDKVVAFSRVAKSVLPGCQVVQQHGRVRLTRGEIDQEKNNELARLVESVGLRLEKYLSGEHHNNVARFRRGESRVAASTYFSILDDGVPAEHLVGYFAGQRALTRWADQHGLMGNRAAGKSLGCFESIETARIGDLLRGLWLTDGYVSSDAREVSYTTASELLSRQIRELLLRCGVLCSRRTKIVNEREYYIITIYKASVSRFAALVALTGRKGARLAARPLKRENINLDALPFSVWSEHPVVGASAWRHARRGMSRDKFRALGGPASVVEQEVSWLQVDEVLPAGSAGCFDLEVATTEHAFVAECTVVHNSTSLELAIPGAIYRQCPTRGSLRDLARERDSNLDVFLSHAGRMYNVRHVVDAVSGKSEALVLGADGLPLYDTTKIRDFDEWAARTFLAPEVLLACTFGSQASGGFLSAKPTERKAILLRSLGLEAWETRAQAAAERAKATEIELAKARAKLDALGADAPHAEAAYTHAESALQANRQCVDVSRQKLADIEATLAQTREELKRKQDLMTERARLETSIEAAQRQSARLQKDIEDLQATLAEGDAIQAAHDRIVAINAEVEQLREARATAAARRESITRAIAEIPMAVADVSQRQVDDARERLTELERQRDDKSIELDKLCEEHAAAVELLELRTAELATFRVQYELLSATRIGALRSGLEKIANRGNAPVMRDASPSPSIVAESTLTKDDEMVSATTDERLALLTKARDEANSASEGLRSARNSADLALEQLKHRVGEATARSVRLADEFARDKERRAEFTRRGIELQREIVGVQADLRQHGERLTALTVEADGLKPLASKLIVLDRAAPTLANLEASLTRETEQLDAATARIGEIDAQCAQFYVSQLKPAALELERDDLRSKLRVDEEAHRVALEVFTEAKLAWTRQQETAADRARLAEQVAALDLELSDWTRLKDDLGKNGIQAAEIDGALDELNVLVNDLLHECHSSRWTVRIDTQRLSGDGKRMIETLDVVILDTETGREGKAETFSGGERAILGEALALALTMVACKRAGLERPTLVRDESGAALDPANARAYIAMLRRAAKYVEASCVVVVSHQPDIAELCDARVEVTP